MKLRDPRLGLRGVRVAAVQVVAATLALTVSADLIRGDAGIVATVLRERSSPTLRLAPLVARMQTIWDRRPE